VSLDGRGVTAFYQSSHSLYQMSTNTVPLLSG